MTVKKIVLGILVCGLFGFYGCSDVEPFEIPETNEQTVAPLNVLDELLSTYDIIEDMATFSDFIQKQDESLLPNEVEIEYIDDDFDDYILYPRS